MERGGGEARMNFPPSRCRFPDNNSQLRLVASAAGGLLHNGRSYCCSSCLHFGCHGDERTNGRGKSSVPRKFELSFGEADGRMGKFEKKNQVIILEEYFAKEKGMHSRGVLL